MTPNEFALWEEIQRLKKRIKRLEHKAKVANEFKELWKSQARTLWFRIHWAKVNYPKDTYIQNVKFINFEQQRKLDKRDALASRPKPSRVEGNGSIE